MEIMSPKAKPGKMIELARNRAFIKAAFLLAAAVVVVSLVRFTPLREYLSPEQLENAVSEAGLMGPVLLAIACAVGTCLFVPGTVFVGIGTAIFGPGLSFACVLPGALAASAISFALARSLGRDFVASLLGDRLKRYDDSIARKGFKTVLLLRLMFVPFAPMNFGMGLTKVRFRDYFFATALGEAATTFVVSFAIGALRDIWISGDWGRLFSTRTVLCFGFLSALILGANLARNRFERRPVPAVRPSTSSEPV
jgi:uncharacterized membrane protein YdjX (TVP38/TMEM64 family)